MSSSALLEPGSRAPEFTAPAGDGNAYSLSGLLPAGHVVLIFYPGNDTPG
ncbi:MAG: redoxin domain-containing protein [Gemmatimonadaceae bacterium]